MKQKEYYKIGEISILYDIGTDSLRYYEDLGILHPRRDNNGYRMYSISDIRTLNILRELRSIGFSMSEIKEHLSDFNLEKTLSLFQREINAIDEKQAELTRLRTQLAGRIREIRAHLEEAVPEQPQILHLPARKIFSLTENVYKDDDVDFIIKKLQKECEDQLYFIGNGSMGATIPLEYIQDGGYGHFNSVFCITESDNYAVSYTHLDVYKRQPYACVVLIFFDKPFLNAYTSPNDFFDAALSLFSVTEQFKELGICYDSVFDDLCHTVLVDMIGQCL